ncbi:hypothetical protein LEP1GSC165_3738 [Leptospira santarosai str. CBC523]|nr:hypothetical protein LEP1GSC165_3738 [Leptospira santarosai str. CBC523]
MVFLTERNSKKNFILSYERFILRFIFLKRHKLECYLILNRVFIKLNLK